MLGNILVTGGAGFIGSHLVDELASKANNVRVFDNLSSGSLANIEELLRKKKIEFVKGDIRNVQEVDDCVQDIDAIIHLAAQISVPLSIEDPDFNNQVNVVGTQNLLKASIKANIPKFVFISSCAVYGDPKYLPLDEKHPANPISPYAQSKLIAEQDCLQCGIDGLLGAVVLRFFNVYGPRQALNNYSGVMTKFIDRIKQNQPPIIYGDGSQTRDFVYVKDIVASIVLALENKRAMGEIFNVGTGQSTTIKQLAQVMLSLTNMEKKPEYAPQRGGDIEHSYANIDKAKKILNYQPMYMLKEGLELLLNEDGFRYSRKSKNDC